MASDHACQCAGSGPQRAMLAVAADTAEAVRDTLEGEYRLSDFAAQIASRGAEAD